MMGEESNHSKHRPLPDAALEELVSVLRSKQRAPVFSGKTSELFDVFALIAREEQLKCPNSLVLPSNLSLDDQLKRLGKLTQCHLRKIKIDDPKAWHKDMGSMIGFFKADMRPCALLFRGGTYSIQFAGERRSQKLSPALADELHHEAYVCYPELEESPVTFGHLVRFMFRGMGSDLWRILLLQLGIGLAALILPIISGFIFDEVIPQRDVVMLWQISLALLLNLLLVSLFTLSQYFGMLRLRLKINQRVQAALWLRLLRLPQGFFKQWEAGDLSLRVSAMDHIQQILSNASINVIFSAIIAVLNMVLIFYYNVQIGFYIALFASILTIIIALVTWFRYHYLKQLWELRGKLASRILQIINNMSKIQLINIANPVFQRWVSLFAEKTRNDYRMGKINNGFVILTMGVSALSTLTLYSLVFLHQDSISFGDFIVINGLVGLFFASYSQLIGILSQALQVIPIYQRAKLILQERPEPRSSGLLHQVQGELELRQLSFQYEGMEQLLLKRISLHIKPGEIIGIVGPSGCGKTTLLRLISGLEVPLSGEILFDGIPLNQLDITELRSQIGFVMQNTLLFPGSIADNIRGHCHSATIEDIAEAARKAQIADEIEAMPMQYYSLLINGGENLSSGQRQRIQLAHVFLAKPKLLLLDEATSALDNINQDKIQKALNEMQVSRIIISHRKTIMRNVQRLYSLKEGELLREL